ncbi:MAG: gamma-glutamyltransferase family protein [Planctomycetia bacterium]|nr:gamma-glutamyltransferase family protein [Planctomycetia bacterium]
MPAMISAPQPLAVEEGAKALMRGGNAYDAALVCAFMQFVLDPHSCGLGGYLLLTHHRAGSGQPQQILDAPAVAGSRVTPEMWEKQVLGPNPGGWGFFLKDKVNDNGYQSICLPAIVRGLEAIHKRWCTWKWADLIAPAIATAENGFAVGAHLAGRWKDKPLYYEDSSLLQKLYVTPDAKQIYLKADGTPYDEGDVLRNPDYAKSLRRLAQAGPDDFYTGELARQMSADLAAHGSWVTAEDLATCGIRDEAPIVTEYRGCTVVTSQAPHGGPTLAAILNILDGYDLSSMRHNSPQYIHLVSMAMKAAFSDRNRTLGDPRFVKVPLDEMLSPARAAHWRRVIDAGQPIDTTRIQPGSKTTTQATVVDAAGNCVSLTHSLGSSSGVITPGLGFMYNNSMVNFHPYSGHPNSIAAGKGRTTGMTPTVVLDGDKPVLVLGAPGATRIITSVLQVILNRLEFGMSMTDAVLAPRFDCQGDTIFCQSRIPEFVCAEVRKKHPIRRIPDAHGGMALVHAIAIKPETGQLEGAADTGADGMALLVE